MAPKRSWAVKVRWTEFQASSLAEPGQMIELPFRSFVGGTPQEEDEIYLLKEKTPELDLPAGIFAVGKVISRDSKSIKLRLDDGRFRNKKQRVKYSALAKDPTIENFEESYVNEWEYHLLSFRTSLRLTPISLKTGRDFDHADSMRCLIAYDECLRKGLSLESSLPVIKAALETGRLVTSVIFKLSNFIALDPRNDAKGFVDVANVDREVWHKYYLPERKSLDVSKLREDLAEFEFNDPEVYIAEEQTRPGEIYQTFKDEDEEETYSRRTRKGQSRFRKALKTLYGSRCAFTGTEEETVLEACHIISHAKTGDNSLDNGLLLRSDIHVLFDEHLITLADDGQRILVHKDVTAPEYAQLRDKTTGIRPSTPARHLALIKQHNSEIVWTI